MGYQGQAIKGFSLLSAVRVITRVLSLVKNIVIARILYPSQFGAFGIATLILTFTEIITETGINTFLIAEKDEVDKYIDTSWLVSILRGLIIFLIIFLSAPLISSFFRNSDSRFLLILISFVPLIRGFINPSVIKFQKHLYFHKEFFYRTSILFVEGFFSIFLILLTHKTESLVYSMLISAVFETVSSFLIVEPRPKFTFKLELFKKVIGYGKWITASTIFNYFYQHGDDITVGRVLGATSLGLYDMAYRISLVPLSDISDVVSKVTFPVYVKISKDRIRLKRAFIKTLGVVVLFTLPVSIILFLFPKEIISIIFGDRWLGATSALRILGVFGFIRAVSSFSQSVFLSLGKQDIFTLISFVGLSGLAITIVPFTITWGITGAATSALVGTALTIPVIFYHLNKYL